MSKKLKNKFLLNSKKIMKCAFCAAMVFLVTAMLSGCGKKEEQPQESSAYSAEDALKKTASDKNSSKTDSSKTAKEETTAETPPEAQVSDGSQSQQPQAQATQTVPAYSEFVTGNGWQGCTVDGITYINGYIIANKTYSLPAWYAPGLDGTAAAMFNQMAQDAAAEGLSIWNQSNFRSYDTQSQIYWNYVSWDGQAAADTYSARPGHSEHQTGLAIDVNQINDTFIGTPEAVWLSDNCWKYGFILRYPSGKEWATGYKYESWHFRYLGDADFCYTLYNGGDWISLEEYFGISSTYSY